VHMRSYQPVTSGHPGQIKKAVRKMLAAQRPVIYSGGGIMNAAGSAALLRELSHTLNAPVTNTLMGLGGVPYDDKQFIGMLGMHGTYEANMAVSHCDLLIAVGARFDDRVTGKLEAFAPDATVIHIDIDPSSISKNIHADLPIVGDVKVVLTQLLEEIARKNGEPDRAALALWWEQIDEWRAVDSLHFEQDPDGPIKPQSVIHTVHKLTHGDAIVATDVGQHQMWSAQHYGFRKPNRFLTSGGLGTMGYGLPAGLGAQIAMPEDRVVVFTGDASVQMCIQELATMYQYKLPVVILVLNNAYMGMVRQWQEMFYESRYSHSYFDALPDFVKLAEAFGGVGMRIEAYADLESGLAEAFAIDGESFVLVDIAVSREENVYPMVPAGAALNEMVLS